MTDCAISNDDLQYKYLHKISMIYCHYLDLYYLHFAAIVQVKVCCFYSFVVYVLKGQLISERPFDVLN